MLSKTGILALAAIASIGAAALVTSTSSADARGAGVSRGGIHFGGLRTSFRHAGIRFHRHHRRHWHVRWHRPWLYGLGTAAVAAPASAAVAAKPASGPCLSKEYTKENLVVFVDRCTRETAAAPIGGAQPMPQQGQAQPTEPMPTK